VPVAPHQRNAAQPTCMANTLVVARPTHLRFTRSKRTQACACDIRRRFRERTEFLRCYERVVE
jgi:hypothetical protein